MRKSRKLSIGQKRLKELLEEKERTGKKVTMSDLMSATGWQKSTVKTYLKKGYLSSHLSPCGDGEYIVKGVLEMSESEFLSSITQTQTIREVGAFCRSKLAQGLVKKSRENMILALELYNRLSNENRLDGFVIMSITAWEQLLKAALIEREGENVIFRPMRPGKPRETISFRECLDCERQSEIEPLDRQKVIHLLIP